MLQYFWTNVTIFLILNWSTYTKYLNFLLICVQNKLKFHIIYAPFVDLEFKASAKKNVKVYLNSENYFNFLLLMSVKCIEI